MTYKDQFPSIPGPLHPSNPLFLELQILKVNDIFMLQIAKFIHKCINMNIISNFNQWFLLNREVHAHMTRSNFDNSSMGTNNLFIPYGRTSNYGLKKLKVSGPKIWNSLPSDIRNIKSLIKFKNAVKNYLLDCYC